MATRNEYELWAAVAIGMIVVVLQHREKPWITRALIAGASGGIGFLAGPEVNIPWLGPLSTAIIVTAFAYALFDIGFGLLQDRALVKRVVDRLVGTDKGVK